MGKTKGIMIGYEDICVYCRRPVECEHHLLFGSGIWELA